MSIIQLNPTIPLDTPKGPGHAFMVIDYSQEHHLLWIVGIDSTGEIWSFQNPEVRMQKNISLGRCDQSKGFIHDLVTGKLDK